MSNEKEIRELVKSMISKEFPDSFTFDEFTGGSLRTRPDLVTFMPNDIIFIEIKSDKDTLDRLEGQVADYSLYADFVYVFLDEVHHKKWWAKNKDKHNREHTYFFKDGKLYYANETLNQEVAGFAYYDYPRHKTYILSFLWKAERYCFTGFLKGRTKILNETLVIEHLYTPKEIVDISHHVLYDRAKNRANSETKKLLTYEHGLYNLEIPYKKHRQELFNNINCERAILISKQPKKEKALSVLERLNKHKNSISNCIGV